MALLQAALFLLFPLGLVIVTHFLLRKKPRLSRWAIWGILLAFWALALWLWIDYNRQGDDVSLMVSGFIAGGATLAAALASTAAMWLRPR